ncbi:MAG: tetratricopeptide repeat protein [Candidatus Delongbacteria bacterium]|nr:tetratricopeptide repeat protein [Candidatus Delongbacteria bacterium]
MKYKKSKIVYFDSIDIFSVLTQNLKESYSLYWHIMSSLSEASFVEFIKFLQTNEKYIKDKFQLKELQDLIKTTKGRLARSLESYLLKSYLQYNNLTKVEHFFKENGFELYETEAAIYHHKKGNFITSFSIYEKLISENRKTDLVDTIIEYAKTVHSFGDLRKTYDLLSSLKNLVNSMSNVEKIKFHSAFVSILISYNEIEKAENVLEQLTKLVDDNSPDLFKLNLLYNTGRIALEKGNYLKAKICFDEYYQMAIKNDNEILLAESYSQMGLYYWSLKKFPKSLDYYILSYKLYQKIGYKPKLCTVTGNVSLLYHLINRNTESLEFSKKFLNLSLQMKSPTAISSAYNYIGLASMASDLLPQAISAFTKQIKYGKLSGDLRTTAFSYNNLAMINAYYQKYKSVIINFNRSFEILNSINSRYEIDVMINIVEYYINQNNRKKAEENYSLLDKLLTKHNLHEDFKESLGKIAFKFQRLLSLSSHFPV